MSTAVTVKHRHQTAFANGASDVSANVWNDSLIIASAANDGSLFVKDSGQTDGWGLLPSVAAGSYLRSAGAGSVPVWSTLVLPNAATQGDLLVATGANTIGSLADVAVGQVLVSGGVGAVPAWSANPTLTGLTASVPGLATTSTDGLTVANPTAATSGVPVQQSPRLRLRSNVWNTTAVAANNTDDWWIESVPVSGAVPSGLLKFGNSLNGAAATFPVTLSSGGSMRILSDLRTDTHYSNGNVWLIGVSGGATYVGDPGQTTRLRSSLLTPPSLADGEWWLEAVGTSPARVAALKLRDAGVTRTLATLTY